MKGEQSSRPTKLGEEIWIAPKAMPLAPKFHSLISAALLFEDGWRQAEAFFPLAKERSS